MMDRQDSAEHCQRPHFALPKATEACQNVGIVDRGRITYFGIFLVLFCCIPAALKAGEDGSYGGAYRVLSGTTDTQSVFDQMIEEREINLAIRRLRCDGFTSDEIQDAVQNRRLRIGSWPGYYACFTYYLIVGRAHLLKQRRVSNF